MLICCSTLFFSCASKSEDAAGENFTFFSDELDATLTYYCKKESSLGPSNTRAKEANRYFIKQNRAITKALFENKKPSTVDIMQMDKKMNDLALSVMKKFDCMLTKVEDK